MARRYFQIAESRPNFTSGHCPRCNESVEIDSLLPLADNSGLTCSSCGAATPRYDLVEHSLGSVDSINWSLFGCDMYIWESYEARLPEIDWYDLQNLAVAKWIHVETFPTAASGERYIPTVSFSDTTAVLALRDSQSPPAQAETPAPPVGVSWYRFGVSSEGSVPAWRQSLFGAATLVRSFPAAAIVLIAAGFEAFFVEAMRVAWRETQIDDEAFEKINRGNIPIRNLVQWLPPIVGKPSLLEQEDLHQRWVELVNKRRNDIVHRAQVHFSSEEAIETMKAALACITFLDEAAIFRPHAYYVSSD